VPQDHHHDLDEAHRTQSGRLARNMRLALPNGAFIGFTGTPLSKQDEITKRVFGDYNRQHEPVLPVMKRSRRIAVEGLGRTIASAYIRSI
jgi:hypothetical protein